MASLFSTVTEVGLVDTRNNPGTIQLPRTNAIPGRILNLKDAYGNFSRKQLTVSTTGGDLFEDGSSSKSFTNDFTFVQLYAGTNNIWYILTGTLLTSQTVSSITVSTVQGDGSLLRNLPAISTLSLLSTIQGLGSAGYVSTASLISTTSNLLYQLNTSGHLSTLNLTSTVQGLGSAGYVSTGSLISTTSNLLYQLNTSGHLSTLNLTSTVQGLGSAGYVSTASLFAIVSTFSTSLGTSFFSLSTGVSSLNASNARISTLYVDNLIIGTGTGWVDIGPLQTVAISSIQATTNTLFATQASTLALSVSTINGQPYNPGGGSIAGAIYTSSLNSTVQGLGSAGYVSTASLISTTAFLLNNAGGLSLTSTTIGLGTLAYVSTASLISTTAFLLNNAGGLSLTSTTIGLGSIGYVSTASLISTTQALQYGYQTAGFISSPNLLSSMIGETASLVSTTGGLTRFTATAGFISSPNLLSSMVGETFSLVSTTGGLTTYVATAGFISSPNLVSTTGGLTTYVATAGFISSPNLLSSMVGETASLVSTAGGLTRFTATAGFISTLNLTSTVTGLGSANYVSTATLQSSMFGLNVFISSFVDPTELTSTVIGLGTAGYVSTMGLLSTASGLASYITSFIDPQELASTVTGLASASYLSTMNLNSSITGLGSLGYVSTVSLISTTGNILYQFNTSGYLSTLNLRSTVQGLGSAGYVSTSQLISTTGAIQYAYQTAGFISTLNLTSTIIGLGSANYISSSQLLSTSYGLNEKILSLSTSVTIKDSDYVIQGSINANQTIPTASDTIIGFVVTGTATNILNYDPQGWWNPTLSTMTPKVAGYYLTSLSVWWAPTTAGNNQNNIQIRKNGNLEVIYQGPPPSTLNSGQSQTITSLIPMNGTTDYISFSAYNGNPGSTAIQPNGTHFNSVLVLAGNVNYTAGFISVPTLNLSLTSTVQGLGTAGYVSTASLISTTAFLLSNAGGTTLTSTTIGLGTIGYVSTASLVSTTANIQAGYATAGFISSPNLVSSVTGLSGSLISTTGGLTRLTATSGFLSTLNLNSTVTGLGSSDYISSLQLTSTTSGTYSFISTFVSSSIAAQPYYYSGEQLYMNYTISSPTVSTGYHQLGVTNIIGTNASDVFTVPNNTSNNLVVSFQTSDPLPPFAATGLWSMNLFAQASGDNVFVYASYYTKSPLDQSETFIATSSNSPFIVQQTKVSLELVVDFPYVNFSSGHSLVAKVFANNSANQNRTLTTFYENGNYSHVHTTLGLQVPSESLTSTVAGLGTAGYVSTQGLTFILTSSIKGLGSAGYISSGAALTIQDLNSSIRGLGSANYVSTLSLVSTTASLTNYVATAGFISSQNLVSTTAGLQAAYLTAGYLSTLNLNSSIIGLGSAGYISTSQLTSTTIGVYTFISSFVDPTELTSTVIGLGTAGYVSTMGLLSTASGLASYITSFIDPQELASTVTGLASASYLSTMNLNSSITGLGTLGYVSTASLISTTANIQGGYLTAGFISSPNLLSSMIGETASLVSTTGGLTRFTATAGFISSPNLVSTTGGLTTYLATAGFISSPNLLSSMIGETESLVSTTGGLTRFTATSGFISSANLVSTTGGLTNYVATAGFISSQNLVSTTTGLTNYVATAGFISTANITAASNSIVYQFNTAGYLSTLNINSTATGLGSLGYISTASLISTTAALQSGVDLNLNSTVTGLGSAGYVSSATLQSTVVSLNSFISSFIDPTELTSTVIGLGTAGYVSTMGLLSTASGLASYITSFIDPQELASTVQGLASASYLSTMNLNSSITGLGTLGYVSTASLVSTTRALQVGYLTAGYLSTLNLTSTVQGLGSANYVSTATLGASLSSFSTAFGLSTSISTLTSQYLYGTQGFISSLIVNSLFLGSNSGFLDVGDMVATSLSTILINTNTAYVNNLLLGSVSSQTALRFYGLQGNFNNTVIAEQSTGTGTQELFLFKGSSPSDRIRLTTTGQITFETQASSQLFGTNPAQLVPTMLLASNSVGIGTTNIGSLLDVGGQGRFIQVSTQSLSISSINGQTFGGPIASTVIGLGSVGYLSSFLFVTQMSTQRMVVSSLGVGCNAPIFTVDVAGSIHGTSMSSVTLHSSSFFGSLADAQTVVVFEM